MLSFISLNILPESAAVDDQSEEHTLESHPLTTMPEDYRTQKCHQLSGHAPSAGVKTCYVNIVGYGKKIALICANDPMTVVAEDGNVYQVAKVGATPVAGIRIVNSNTYTSTDHYTLISHPLHTMSVADKAWQCNQVFGYTRPRTTSLTVCYVDIISRAERIIALICCNDPRMVIAEDGHAYEAGQIRVPQIFEADAESDREENTLISHPLHTMTKEDREWECSSRGLRYSSSTAITRYVYIPGYGKKKIALVCSTNPMVIVAEDGFEYYESEE